MANIVLDVADVHKSFGGLHALSDINLEIEEGKTRAIIGPNGAGKSTCSTSASAVSRRMRAR